MTQQMAPDQVLAVRNLNVRFSHEGRVTHAVRDLRRDPMVVRRRYAAQMVENAVVTGVTTHGDEFALAVEPAPEPVLSADDERPRG